MTIDKDKTCIIISSYPTSHLDNSVLGLTIESWKQQGYDILLTAHAPINQDLQKAVEFVIYSDENELLYPTSYSDISFYIKNSEYNFRTNYGNTLGHHSYAILLNLKNSLQLLSIKKYSHFIFIDSDQFLTTHNHQVLQEKFIKTEFINKDSWFFLDGELAISNFFGGKIDYFKEMLKPTNSSEDYVRFCTSTTGFTLEAFLYKTFVLGDKGNSHFENNKPQNLFSNEWFGNTQMGKAHIPGLTTYEGVLDIVRDYNSNDHLYVVVSPSANAVLCKLVIYSGDSELSRVEIQTGPLYWYRFRNTGENWKAELLNNNQVIRTVEYTGKKIKENMGSMFHLFS